MTLEIERMTSVTKALRVLKVFNTENPVWRIGEISEKLSISKSTASRIVQTTALSEFWYAPQEKPLNVLDTMGEKDEQVAASIDKKETRPADPVSSICSRSQN